MRLEINRTKWKKEDNLDLEKCHGITTYVLHKLLDKSINFCFAVTIRHEYDKQKDIIVKTETDDETENCCDLREDKKVLDLEKCNGIWAIICMHDNGDDNLSTLNDFHVGNVKSNCK